MTQLRIRILRLPGVEGACKTMAASHNVNAAKAFVARFEGACKTVAAARNASALLNFAPHPIVFPSSYAGEGKRDGL